MARIIRFPLKMSNGTEVRTLEELQENFDLQSILGYFADGKLQTWLESRYYDEAAEKVSALSADMPDLNAKLCEILGVEYQQEEEVDLEYIQRRNEKKRIIADITADKNVLENIDAVALNQDDLYDALDNTPSLIYLYGEKYSIPFGVKNIRYIGLNNPLVILDKGKFVDEYEDAGITFENVQFEEKAQPEMGEKLFLAGKYKEAFPIVECAAKNGYPRAMYLLARYYHDGYDTVEVDEGRCEEWCKNAKTYDDPLLLYGYAKWCDVYNCEGDEIDARIFPQLRNLANQGNAMAQLILGEMSETEEEKEAAKWYKKAAKQGLAVAQLMMGTCYQLGTGVEINEEEAVEWYRKAAEQGVVDAQYELGLCYFYGDGIDENKEQAFEWFKKAATQGSIVAQDILANCYYNGLGTQIDFSKALEWYGKIAGKADKKNDFVVNAFYYLGHMYFNGEGIKRDYTKAAEYYKHSADNGNENAQFELGYMYEMGYGVPKDISQAVYWYRRAARMQNQSAVNKLHSLGYSIDKWCN